MFVRRLRMTTAQTDQPITGLAIACSTRPTYVADTTGGAGTAEIHPHAITLGLVPDKRAHLAARALGVLPPLAAPNRHPLPHPFQVCEGAGLALATVAGTPRSSLYRRPYPWKTPCGRPCRMCGPPDWWWPGSNWPPIGLTTVLSLAVSALGSRPVHAPAPPSISDVLQTDVWANIPPRHNRRHVHHWRFTPEFANKIESRCYPYDICSRLMSFARCTAVTRLWTSSFL